MILVLQHQLWQYMVQVFYPSLYKMGVQHPVSWTAYFGWLFQKSDAQLRSIAQEEEIQLKAWKSRYETLKCDCNNINILTIKGETMQRR